MMLMLNASSTSVSKKQVLALTSKFYVLTFGGGYQPNIGQEIISEHPGPGQAVFVLDEIIVLVNIGFLRGGVHWARIVIFPQRHEITYYDSLKSTGTIRVYITIVHQAFVFCIL